MGIVYIIKNTVNDKVYIGSTARKLNERIREHKCRANKGTRRSELYEEMRRIGADNFYIEALEDNVLKESLYEKELEYINSYPDKTKLLNTVKGFTYSFIQELIKEYQEGATLKELAEKHNKCKKQISRIFKDNNVPIRDWNNEQKAKVSKEELIELYVNRLKTTIEIAAMFNVSHTAILNHLKKCGIDRRSAVNRKYL